MSHPQDDNLHLLRHENELDALRLICDILAQHSGQREMFSRVMNILVTKLEFQRPTIMLLSTDGSELTIEAASDMTASRQDVKYSRGEGITGKVLQTGQPAIVPQISEEPSFKNRIHNRQRTSREKLSFICTPIVIGKEVIGTISTDVVQAEDEWLDEVLRVLNIVASLIANDVHTRRMATMQQESLREENERLRGQLGEVMRPENMIGNSNEIRLVYQKVAQVAMTSTTALIRGESGTGKELIASAIHYGSPRQGKPFIKVNCAALSETLLESELFGHEKGAFTGAMCARIGRIEQAEGGTLFLDEIGDFSPAVQVKLLRVLQEREYERVGSNTTMKADVRIIAATNRNLEVDCEDGTFRQDLYYRINVFPIQLPALRDRKGDILLLANHFVSKYAESMNKPVTRISTNAINMMMAYHWPGNVRELENCMEYAVLVATDEVIHGYHLPPTLQTPDSISAVPGQGGTLKERVHMLEKDLIIDSLKRNKGSVVAASEELGITDRMVRYKIKNLSIDYKKLFKKKQ